MKFSPTVERHDGTQLPHVGEHRARTSAGVERNQTTMAARIRQLAERTVADAYRTMSIRHVDPASVAGCLCRARPLWEDPCERCGRSDRATLPGGGR